MLLPVYLDLLRQSESTLARSFRTVAEGHGDEPDVRLLCHTLADQCDAHANALSPLVRRYGPASGSAGPERLHQDAIEATRSGPLGLVRDLQDLYVIASLVESTWVIVKQAGQGLRDEELLDIVARCDRETSVQLSWLRTRLKQAAPQALVAAL